jgi:hypothetical protein
MDKLQIIEQPKDLEIFSSDVDRLPCYLSM